MDHATAVASAEPKTNTDRVTIRRVEPGKMLVMPA
jgi:hypothetical protein